MVVLGWRVLAARTGAIGRTGLGLRGYVTTGSTTAAGTGLRARCASRRGANLDSVWDGTRQDVLKNHGLHYHSLSYGDAEALAEQIMEARKGKENVAPAAAAEPSAGPSRTRTSPDEDADDDSEWEEAPKRKKRKLRR